MTPTFSVHRTLLGVLVGVLLFSLVSLPKAHGVVVSQTRHFTNMLAYGGASSPWFLAYSMYLQEGLSGFTVHDSAEKIVSGNTRACQWSIDVCTLNFYGNVTNTIGSKVAMVERATNGSGYQSGYWNATATNLTRLDGLQIYVYMRTRLGATYSSWESALNTFSTGLDNFITEHLGMDKLLASTWNVTYYTERHTATTFVHGIFHIGNETMDSRISNIQFDNGVTTATETALSPYAMLLLGVGFGFLLTAVVFRTAKPTTPTTR